MKSTSLEHLHLLFHFGAGSHSIDCFLAFVADFQMMKPTPAVPGRDYHKHSHIGVAKIYIKIKMDLFIVSTLYYD